MSNAKYEFELELLLRQLIDNRPYIFLAYNTGNETDINLQFQDSSYGDVEIMDLNRDGFVTLTCKQSGVHSRSWIIHTKITTKGRELWSLLSTQREL